MQTTIDLDERTLSIEEKRDLGEGDFNAWLRLHGVGFMCLDQSPAGFSPTFKDCLKRPDFLVPIELIGTLAVDVKNRRRRNNGNFTFPLGELKLAENFERRFGLYFWYAYRSREEGNKVVWYWISVHKIKVLLKAAKLEADFLEIEPQYFERVETANDLSKLCSHLRRHKGQGAEPVKASSRRHIVPA